MKIGITFGAFDLVHAGHHILFEDARRVCDYLIVGLHVDPSVERPDTKQRPVMSVLERFIILKGCKWIDEIIPYETEADLINILKWRRPAIRVIGSDYSNRQFTGQHWTKDVYYSPRRHDYSSTELKRRVKKGRMTKKKK